VRAAGDRREARAAFIRRLASRRGREGGHSSRSRGAWESQSSPLVGVGRGGPGARVDDAWGRDG
jgi:hypothetical protein